MERMDDLVRRLDDLERRARLWPYLSGVLVLLGVLVGAVAFRGAGPAPAPAPAAQATKAPAQAADVVTARELRLVDKDGNLRALLTIEVDNGTALTFFDPDGTGRMWLSTSPDGEAMFSLADLQGRRRLEQEIRFTGAPSLKLVDSDHVDRLIMAMSGKSASLMIMDPRTNANWQVP